MNLFYILAQGYQKPIKQTMERSNRELLAVNNNLLKYENFYMEKTQKAVMYDLILTDNYDVT